MKKKALLAAVLTLVLSGAGTVQALDLAKQQALKSAIQLTPAIEMAAKSAQLLAEAPVADREDAGVEIIQAVAKKSPASAVSVVSALVTVDASVAPRVVAMAVELLPEQAESLARIAAVAAPDMTAAVIAEVAMRDSERKSSSVATKRVSKAMRGVVEASKAASNGAVTTTATTTAPTTRRSSLSSSSTGGGTPISTTIFTFADGTKVYKVVYDNGDIETIVEIPGQPLFRSRTPGLGFIVRATPINARVYPGGVFPANPPRNISNYARPGSDPDRD